MTTEHARASARPQVAGTAQVAEAMSGTQPTPKAKGGSRRYIGMAVLALAVAVGTAYYLHARHYEDTDDAQVDANITNLSPRVAGTVIKVNVVDNQLVIAGDVLAEIDPTDFEVAVAQAKASLAQAEAGLLAENPSVEMTETTNETSLSAATADLTSAESGLLAASREVSQLRAELATATANAKNAEQERARTAELHATGAVSQAELDNRTNAADASRATVAAMGAALAGAEARYAQAQSRIVSMRSRVVELKANAPRQLDVRRATVNARHAARELAKAQLRQAELNLTYTKIVAPISGITGRKAMNVGDRVAPGQQLLAISDIDDLWITANFRETQIRDMHPGQPVRIAVDRLGTDLRGTVESVAGATGSRFSLFPPENAAGNYVKVVQRHAGAHPLRARPAGARPSTTWNVGGARGPGPMTTAAVARNGRRLLYDRLDGRTKPLDHRPRRHHGDVHGGARHQHRQRLASPHRGRPRSARTRARGCSRRTSSRTPSCCPSAVGSRQARSQALLHDLRRALHHKLAPLRDRALPSGGSSSSASSKASAAADSAPANSRSWPTPFRLRNVVKPSPCTAWP